MNLKMIFSLCLISFCEIIFSQNTIIEQKLGPIRFWIDRTDDIRIGQLKLKDSLAQTIVIDNLDSLNQSSYWIYMANYDFFLNRGSHALYFNKAINLHPKLTCRIVKLAGSVNSNEINSKKSSTNKYFITDFDSSIKNEINEKCAIYFETKKETKFVPFEQQLKASEIAAAIMKNDQQERVKQDLDWNIQNKLDSIKRKFLDSLYSSKSTLLGYLQVELDAFTFVLHHSNDYDWNIKWFRIWLDEKFAHGDKLKAGMLLGPAFERFKSDPATGKLNKDDFAKLKMFFDTLKEKYPKEFLQSLNLY